LADTDIGADDPIAEERILKNAERAGGGQMVSLQCRKRPPAGDLAMTSGEIAAPRRKFPTNRTVEV
jgi:hypothetical protein